MVNSSIRTSIYFATAFAVVILSMSISTFAQNYIDPLSLIGRSNDPTLSQRTIDNNKALLNLLLQRQNQRQPLPSGCDTGHWVQQVTDGGRIVSLENGSIWEISPIDRIDTALWLTTTNISICGGDTLVNLDDREKVSARRIR